MRLQMKKKIYFPTGYKVWLRSFHKKKDLNIVIGDLNVKVGVDNRSNEEVIGMHGLGEANDNGERFISLRSISQLVIGGTVFPHKRIHKATWISSDGRTENQIDHFGISKNLEGHWKMSE
ncbi:craniofacial development protein 2 [Elysia marginata]|uniref:Craniofacial development protein 2 n=1 Tax=Elysia marginata TaxID=1093978 RepID=A0AAV4HJM4_9GAST|nr:craniofacial development protein 2 [Elysia marginata]